MEWALHLSACCQISLMDSSPPWMFCLEAVPVQHPLVLSFLQLSPELLYMLSVLALEVKASFHEVSLILSW